MANGNLTTSKKPDLRPIQEPRNTTPISKLLLWQSEWELFDLRSGRERESERGDKKIDKE